MSLPQQVYPPAPFRVGLTARQRDCFDIIESHIATFKHPPSMQEIADMMNFKSKGRVVELLRALEERGWIRITRRRARAIAIIPDVVLGGYLLPPAVDAKLRTHCAATGENPADVLADAVTLFFDEAEGSVAA